MEATGNTEECVCRGGYSYSSWENSFDSQCLEIIRGRGGHRVLPRQPPIRGQRKIFPFITRIFSVLVSAWTPNQKSGWFCAGIRVVWYNDDDEDVVEGRNGRGWR